MLCLMVTFPPTNKMPANQPDYFFRQLILATHYVIPWYQMFFLYVVGCFINHYPADKS